MPAPAYVGRTFRLPEPFDVTAQALGAFARAVGVTHPACLAASAARALGYRGVVAAPTFAVVIAQAAEALYVGDPAAGIDFAHLVHASERFTHHRPIVAGDVLDAACTVESITARGGVTLVTTRVDITSDAEVAPHAHRPGAPDTVPVRSDAVRVATVRSTFAIRDVPDAAAQPAPAAAPAVSAQAADDAAGQAAAPAAGAAAADSAAAAGAAPAPFGQPPALASTAHGAPLPRPHGSVAKGDAIGHVSLAFTRDTLVRYAAASGDFNPIHYNEAAARAAGLPGVIAHGMLTMGAVSSPLVNWAGDPGAILDYEVRFGRPAPVPWPGQANLDVTGTVAGIDEAARTARVNLAVTQDGAKVLGKAQATIQLA
jgi:acyl dehydratase